jgi:hypothetical protein
LCILFTKKIDKNLEVKLKYDIIIKFELIKLICEIVNLLKKALIYSNIFKKSKFIIFGYFFIVIKNKKTNLNSLKILIW